MVLTSLHLTETYFTKSKSRFRYSLLYKERGQFLHGLNRYYLTVGVDILKFTFHPIFISLGTTSLIARKFIDMKVLCDICDSLVPLSELQS